MVESSSSQLEKKESSGIEIILCEDYESLSLNNFLFDNNSQTELKKPYINWNTHFFDTINDPSLETMLFLITGTSNYVLSQDSPGLNKIALFAILRTDIEKKATLLLSKLQTIKLEQQKPIIVFVVDDLGYNQIFFRNIIQKKENAFTYDIRKIFMETNNEKQLLNCFLKIYSFYNQLGDEFLFVFNEIPYSFNYIKTLVIGAPGCGKSTFINKILKEQRCYSGIGTTATLKIIEYHHKKYPLKFYDTPGFQNTKDHKILLGLIEEHFTIAQKKSSDLMHLILYFINGESKSKGEDIPLIKDILKYNIPLIFIISHSLQTKETDNIRRLSNTLSQNDITNIDAKSIISMNLVNPLYNYDTLLNQIYTTLNTFAQIKFDLNLDPTINLSKNKENLFCKSINNKEDLLNRAHHKAIDTICLLIEKKVSEYYLSSSNFKDLNIVYEPSLIKNIASCYGFNITEENAKDLISGWNISLDKDIDEVDLKKYFKEYIKMYYEKIKSLANKKPNCEVLKIEEVIKGYCLIGLKAKKYYLTKRINKGFIDMINEGIKNYKIGIDAFKDIKIG